MFLLDRSGLFDEAGRPEDRGEAGGQPEQRRLRHPRQTRPPSQRSGQFLKYLAFHLLGMHFSILYIHVCSFEYFCAVL